MGATKHLRYLSIFHALLPYVVKHDRSAFSVVLIIHPVSIGIGTGVRKIEVVNWNVYSRSLLV